MKIVGNTMQPDGIAASQTVQPDGVAARYNFDILKSQVELVSLGNPS